MKWITRKHLKLDRVACPWRIERFIDSDAECKERSASHEDK